MGSRELTIEWCKMGICSSIFSALQEMNTRWQHTLYEAQPTERREWIHTTNKQTNKFRAF
jgi:hypothetical protein